jgi:predicted outer membrane protein
MKSWLAVGLLCISPTALAADKTPAKTPSTAPAPQPSTKSTEPTKLTVEEGVEDTQEPKNKEVDTKSNDSGKKPSL